MGESAVCHLFPEKCWLVCLRKKRVTRFPRFPRFPNLWGSNKSHRIHDGSMYAIYGNIYHQYTPNVSIYTNIYHTWILWECSWEMLKWIFDWFFTNSPALLFGIFLTLATMVVAPLNAKSNRMIFAWFVSKGPDAWDQKIAWGPCGSRQTIGWLGTRRGWKVIELNGWFETEAPGGWFWEGTRVGKFPWLTWELPTCAPVGEPLSNRDHSWSIYEEDLLLPTSRLIRQWFPRLIIGIGIIDPQCSESWRIWGLSENRLPPNNGWCKSWKSLGKKRLKWVTSDFFRVDPGMTRLRTQQKSGLSCEVPLSVEASETRPTEIQGLNYIP